MTAKKLNIILGVILSLMFLALIGFAFNNRSLRHDLGTTKGQLKRTIKDSQRRMDSALNLVAKSEARVLRYQHFIEQQDKEREAERADAAKQQRHYEKILRTRIDRAMPNPELDSLVTGFLAGH